MMEKYSEDLENKVAMKTHQLRSQQAGKSLSKYLPRFGHLMNRVVVAVPVQLTRVNVIAGDLIAPSSSLTS